MKFRQFFLACSSIMFLFSIMACQKQTDTAFLFSYPDFVLKPSLISPITSPTISENIVESTSSPESVGTFNSLFEDEIFARYIASECQKDISDSATFDDLESIIDISISEEYDLHSISGIEHLPNVESISLYRTSVSVLPDSIDHLQKLSFISLYRNKLTYLPASIANIETLEILSLVATNISEFPEVICDIPNLKSLELFKNEITLLPDSIGKLTKLESLNLSMNQLTEFPESLGQLTSLQSLNLTQNNFATLPSSLGNLHRLETIGIVSRNDNMTLPESIVELKNITYIDINDSLVDTPLFQKWILSVHHPDILEVNTGKIF